MSTIIRRYELEDQEWARLAPYFEEDQGRRIGRPRRDARELLNGILWIARSGAAWRDLPERYGPWQTVYKRFVQWQESGLLERIFREIERISKFLKMRSQRLFRHFCVGFLSAELYQARGELS